MKRSIVMFAAILLVTAFSGISAASSCAHRQVPTQECAAKTCECGDCLKQDCRCLEKCLSGYCKETE